MARAVKWQNRTIRQIRLPAPFVDVVEEIARLLDHDNSITTLTINVNERTYNNPEDNQIVHLKYSIEATRELVSLATADTKPEENEAVDVWVNPEQLLVNAMLSPWFRQQEIAKLLKRTPIKPLDDLGLYETDDLIDEDFDSNDVHTNQTPDLIDTTYGATRNTVAFGEEPEELDSNPEPVAFSAIDEQLQADSVYYHATPIAPVAEEVVEPPMVEAESFVVINQVAELQPACYDFSPVNSAVAIDPIVPVAEVISTTPPVVETLAPIEVAEVGGEVAEVTPTINEVVVESPISTDVEDGATNPVDDDLAMSHETVDPIADESVAPMAIAQVGPVVIEIEDAEEFTQPTESATEEVVTGAQAEVVITTPDVQIGEDLIQQVQQLQESEKLHQFACRLYETWKEIAEQQSSLPWNVPVALETIYRQSFAAMMGHEFVYQVGRVIQAGKDADIIPVLIPGANNLDINQQEVEFITYRDTSIVAPAPSILTNLAVEIAMQEVQESQSIPVEVVHHTPDEHDLSRLRAERQQHLANVRSNSQNKPGKPNNGSANAKTGWKRLLPW